VSEKVEIPLTRLTGEFVAGLSFENLPREAVARVCNGITDCAAVTILAHDEPVTHLIETATNSIGSIAEARVCFSSTFGSAPDAALVNATAGHAHDYDDTGIGVHPAHPSVVLASAVLAEGEAIGATGPAMIAAYVAGYEVWGELARRDKQAHTLGGFHPTSVFGTVAAAAAVANLLALDAGRASFAVGIAASFASGLVGNFGSMTKPMHAGRAAQSGILAARLARDGMTAAPDILESKLGFLMSFSPAGEVDLHSAPIYKNDWWILRHGLNFKLYPACYSGHRALDGMLDLVAEHNVAADDVEEITVNLTAAQSANLFSHAPKTVSDAKFSIEFMMAMAIVARRATFAELSEAFLNREDVAALIKRVRISPCLPTSLLGLSPQDRISVLLKDGRRLERSLTHPRGHAARPLDIDVLWTKFADCVSGAMSQSEARKFFDRLQSFDRLRSMSELPFVAGTESAVGARAMR
jgi:2-methylcitrate dehydratase PrpD